MLKIISIVLGSSVLLTACATYRPTPYMPSAGKGMPGYSIVDVKDGLKISSFSASMDGRAYQFSRLAAIEDCMKERQFTVLLKTVDLSTESTTLESSTSSYTIPGYSKFDGKKYRDTSKDVVQTNTSTYPVTIRHPQYGTVFRCIAALKTLDGGPEVETLSKELVSPITQDFKGGLLVKDAKTSKALKTDDVILSVDGKRIQDGLAMLDALSVAKSEVQIGIIRNKKMKKIKVIVVDQTDLVRAQNLVALKSACEQVQEDESPINSCRVFETSKKTVEEETPSKVPKI